MVKLILVYSLILRYKVDTTLAFINNFMMPRISHVLFFASVLMTLTACGTSTPRQDEERSSAQVDARGDYDSPEWRLFDLQHDSANRSLAEVAALSAGMNNYQPDLVLEILRSLEPVPSGQLETLIDQQNHDPELTEWLELAVQVRSVAISGHSGSIAAAEWSRYHYGHVVNRSNFPELVAGYRAFFTVPSQVAVLLPAEGRLSTAAKAIRDGIMSAYLDQPGGAVIRFYSSGQNSESAIAALRRASDDGAMQIIGPLHIDSTRAIAGLGGSPIPVLLLNDKDEARVEETPQVEIPTDEVQVDEAPADRSSGVWFAGDWFSGDIDSGMEGNTERAGVVNSLSLSNTHEATTIAARALAQGQREAIVIVPDNAWGKRIEAAFSMAFEQGGGQIMASTRFATAESDHSAMLTQLLEIDASKQRKSDLQSWLGITLTFEPSRRHDFGFIFLAASPAEGRELKPLLRFHDAGDVPVYAMGRIFSGRIDRASDQDLNGIVFPATRWQLQAERSDNITPASVRGGVYGNLYALGLDAWRLLPWLPLMQKDPDLWFPGEVGSLRLQPDGSFNREPEWAQFSAGAPTAFQWQASQ